MKVLIFRTVAHQMNISSYNSQELGLAKAFFDKGHSCDVIYYTYKKERIDVIKKNKENEVRLIWKRGFPLLRTGIYPKYFSSKELNKYDLIICNEYNQIMSLVVAKRHTNGVTFVYNGPYYNMFKIPYFDRIYDFLFSKLFEKNVDYFFAKSPLSKKYLADRGIENVETVGVAIDTAVFEDYRGISDRTVDIVEYMKKRKCLLYIGSLSKRKNFEFLIRTFERICEINSDLDLVIIGKGKSSYVRYVLSGVSDGVRKRIMFIDRIENKELGTIYKTSKGFIIPSIKEIFGMVILEAMYFGAVVFSSINGGSMTLIKNQYNGFILEDFSEERWARTIVKETRNEQNLEYISRNAIKTIKDQYLWSNICDIFLKRYYLVKNQRKLNN